MHFIYLNHVLNDEINTKTQLIEVMVRIHAGLKLSGFPSQLHELGLKLR